MKNTQKELENMVETIKFFNNITALINVEEFKLRFISTILLSLLFIFIFLLGNIFCSIFFSFIFSLLFFEYEKLISVIPKKLDIFKIILLQISLLSFTILEIYELNLFSLNYSNYIIFLFISVLINIIFSLNKKLAFITFIISNLIIFSFFSLIGILQKKDGLYMILYVVILVSTMDIFAYLGGKLFGKRKIIPQISRGKTIEGSCTGLLITIIMSYLIRDLINFTVVYSIIYGFIIGFIAFFGDLIESIFKRNIGVKDSGKLIPGHGGLMDRFDGYFLVLPFFYIFIN